jgi:hypothetical protein
VRRRRPTRTFKGDLERLRERVAAQAPSVPLDNRALLAVGFLIALLVLAIVLLLPLIGPDGSRAPRRQVAKANLTEVPPVNVGAKVRTLQPGDRKAAVADLQTALGALGFYSAPIDGVYGDSTGAAVLAFQVDHGLAADGVAGPSTMKTLAEAVSAGARADAATVQEGLESASGAGRISDASLTHVKKLLDDAVSRLATMPPGRIASVAPVFHEVAAQAAEYNGARALALVSMLKTNVDFRARHKAATQKDIRDEDGVVYRFFENHGYQFHPIAAFASLNTLARRGNREAVALGAGAGGSRRSCRRCSRMGVLLPIRGADAVVLRIRPGGCSSGTRAKRKAARRRAAVGTGTCGFPGHWTRPVAQPGGWALDS